MKKILTVLLCFLMLTACASDPAETILPNDTAPNSEVQIENQQTEVKDPTYLLNIYAPSDYYFEGDDTSTFATVPVSIHSQDANLILDMLKEYSILNDEIQLNSFEITGSQLNIDFNEAFLYQLLTYGTTGEQMMIGSVVNTFLSVYDAETVFITVDAKIMESGHVIYDFPMEYFE